MMKECGTIQYYYSLEKVCD